MTVLRSAQEPPAGAALAAVMALPLPAARGAGTPFALAAVLAIVLIYNATVWSMVQIWARSQTFAHGFVVVPICAWLIWRQRHSLAAVAQRPNPWALALLVPIGLLWLLADIANVQVITHYAVVAMLPVAVLAILGRRFAWAIGFPLAYLLVAVPFGEFLIAPLIDFTARFTVAALQLSGVPVYRDNNFFSIPSGNWSVVEACSGLRYLIAGATLGTLYAYLNFASLGRRLIFIVISLVLPILANGVRAYLIVMIGHWSDMRMAVGIDHLIYGWLFFGLVLLALFWVGSYWREAPPRQALPKPPARPVARARFAYTAVATVALAA